MFLSALIAANNILLGIALAEYDTAEYPGTRNNPEVVRYAEECGVPFRDDATPWCGSFVCFVLTKAGYKEYIPKYPALARSWLKVPYLVDAPVTGDIVIFYRNGRHSQQGHVGFFVRYSEDKQSIYVLGGNQGNRVSIIKYPTYRVLGFRRIPVSVPGEETKEEKTEWDRIDRL